MRVFGHRPPLTEDERRLVLRSMTIIAIPLATICLFALLITGAVAYHYTHAAIASNEGAINDSQDAIAATRNLALALNAVRRSSERALAWQVYDECVENEAQDAANATLFRKVYRLVSEGPPSRARNDLLETLQETIDAREPPDEKPCQQPVFPRPRSVVSP